VNFEIVCVEGACCRIEIMDEVQSTGRADVEELVNSSIGVELDLRTDGTKCVCLVHHCFY
jgi:hypothetical protein